MKNVKELKLEKVKHIVWGNPNETFTRLLSLALLVCLWFFVSGTSWLFCLTLILICLVNWFWRFYFLEVKK